MEREKESRFGPRAFLHSFMNIFESMRWVNSLGITFRVFFQVYNSGLIKVLLNFSCHLHISNHTCKAKALFNVQYGQNALYMSIYAGNTLKKLK